MTNREKPIHAPMDQFPYTDGLLQINGRSIRDITEQINTPCYLYDRSLIDTRVNELRAALPPAIHLHYAMKANPMAQVVEYLGQRTDGIDVASHGELSVALASGIDAKDISFAGPGKSQQDLLAAITAGVIINVESESELSRIVKISAAQDTLARVAFRINPDFELKGSGMTMGGGAKPFGIDAEKIPELLKSPLLALVDFQGFHIFWGSQNLKPELIIDAHNKTFALARRLCKELSSPPKWLNIGGGLGVPYFPGEQRLDLTPICANLEQLLAQYQEFKNTEIVMELGRYLVAESGLYVCEVIERKESRGETFLITNGGLHHHLSASGNFGQVIRKNYPVGIATRPSDSDTEIVSVVGPLCTPLDLLAQKMRLPVSESGDLVVIYQSGAYGFSASPQQFLSHPLAEEQLI